MTKDEMKWEIGMYLEDLSEENLKDLMLLVKKIVEEQEIDQVLDSNLKRHFDRYSELLRKLSE